MALTIIEECRQQALALAIEQCILDQRARV